MPDSSKTPAANEQCLVCPDKPDYAYATAYENRESGVNPHSLCCRICSEFWDSLGFTKQREWFGLPREERTKRFQQKVEQLKAMHNNGRRHSERPAV